MAVRNKKIANAGVRLLEILKELVHEPLSYDDMLKIVNQSENAQSIFAKETISKYLNTLKVLGFEVQKINNKFYFKNNIDKIKFDLNEIRTYIFLKECVQELSHTDINKNLMNLFSSIEASMDEKAKNLFVENISASRRIKGYSIDQSENIIRTFEKYCSEKLKLKITYKKGEKIAVYKIDPKGLLFKNNKTFILGYDYLNNEYRELLIENIEEAEQQPQKISDFESPYSVTYKLKGHLAKVYVLRNEEKIIEEDTNSITIVNSSEDRESLISRLLRYSQSCEILYPVKYREEFKELLDKMLAIYE